MTKNTHKPVPVKRKKRKPNLPPDVFWVAEEGYRPVFCDTGGGRYAETAKMFYRLMDQLFPVFEKHTFSSAAEQKIIKMIPTLGIFYPRGAMATIRSGDPALRETVNKLFLLVQNSIQAAHLSGIERGKSLLIRLAKGEITAKQLNDSSLE